jgi:hypothetical protein
MAPGYQLATIEYAIGLADDREMIMAGLWEPGNRRRALRRF